MTPSSFVNGLLRHFRYGAYLNPVRDWLALVIFSAIAFAGIVVWHVWIFDTVANGGVIGSAATSTATLFSNSSLDAINTVFKNRAVEEEKYETGIYRFADPSQ